MENKLEKFKFATIKNLSIRVQENENDMVVSIEPVDTEKCKAKEKKIEINYKPLDNHERGDFHL